MFRIKQTSLHTTKQPTEHEEQSAFIQYVKTLALKTNCPQLNLIFAIPNGARLGGNRYAQARKLKAEGVRNGVPDLFLPFPVGRYYGMFIEFKRDSKSKVSQEQIVYIQELNTIGYYATVVYGLQDGITKLNNYLQRKC